MTDMSGHKAGAYVMVAHRNRRYNDILVRTAVRKSGEKFGSDATSFFQDVCYVVEELEAPN